MSQYRIRRNEDLFVVEELATDHIVYAAKEYGDAQLIYKKLKNGSAFNGLTPNFFCENIVNKTDTKETK